MTNQSRTGPDTVRLVNILQSMDTECGLVHNVLTAQASVLPAQEDGPRNRGSLP